MCVSRCVHSIFSGRECFMNQKQHHIRDDDEMDGMRDTPKRVFFFDGCSLSMFLNKSYSSCSRITGRADRVSKGTPKKSQSLTDFIDFIHFLSSFGVFLRESRQKTFLSSLSSQKRCSLFLSLSSAFV